MLIAIIILCSILGILLLFFLFGLIAALISLSKPGITHIINKDKKSKDKYFDTKYDLDFLNNEFTLISNKINKRKIVHAYLYRKEHCHRYIIYTHGYAGNPADKTIFLHSLKDKININILLIEQRAHQNSKCFFTTMGIRESDDLVSWCNYIKSLDDKAKIIIYGQSMGGMTVLRSLNNHLPTNVKCAVVDSAYASLYEQFLFTISTATNKFLAKILIFGALLFFLVVFKINIISNNAYKSLSNNDIPIMFIQGDDDEVVPFKCLDKNYNACNKNVYKEKYVFPHAKHVLSYQENPTHYLNIFISFISRE